MKYVLWLFVLCTLCGGRLYAQEMIYLANGNRTTGKLTGIEGEKVKFSVVQKGKPMNYALRRENVLLAFEDDGRYLVINSLDADPVKAQEQIDLFHKGAAPRLTHDLLIRANPPLLIQGNISYESDEVVNYKSLSGASASINKRELASIFYRNGRHSLLMPPASVVMALNGVKGELLRLLTPPPTVSKIEKQPAVASKTTKVVAAKTGPPPAPSAPSVKQSVPEKRTTVESGASAPTEEKPSLSDAQYQQYRASALQRVDEFVAYLNIIVDKSLDDDKKDKAIEQATALFMPDATIEVTSSKRPGVRKLKIENYLNNLKMSVYASASIEWNEIQYVSELTQAADGNYYGVITGQQTFTGYAENGQDVLYSDVTQKSVKVKLQSYRKSNDKGAELKWAVLLGNIGVVTK